MNSQKQKVIQQSNDMNNETFFEQVRSLPRAVWILFLGLFIHRFGTFVIPFLTLYLNASGYNTSQIGTVFASLALGGIGAMFLGGWLTDLIGRRNTMAISLFGVAITMIVLWQSDSFFLFTVSAFFCGLMGGMYHPASNSLLMDVVPPERRITAFATVRWAINLGFAFGMAAGGVLADKNFAYLFIGDAVSSAVFAGIALFTLPHGIRTTKEQSRWGPALASISKNRPFMAFVVANQFAVITFFLIGSAVALFTKDLGYSKTVYGAIMAINGVMIALFELWISQKTRNRSPRHVIALGFFICGAGMWLNLFAFNWIIIAIAITLFTIGEMIALPISSAYVASLAPEMMRGRYSASVGLTWNIGQGVAPWLGLVLYQHHPDWLWWSCLVFGFICFWLMTDPAINREP